MKAYITELEILDEYDDLMAKFSAFDENYEVKIDKILSSDNLKEIAGFLKILENNKGQMR